MMNASSEAAPRQPVGLKCALSRKNEKLTKENSSYGFFRVATNQDFRVPSFWEKTGI
jgi:hypothetical protein